MKTLVAFPVQTNRSGEFKIPSPLVSFHIPVNPTTLAVSLAVAPSCALTTSILDVRVTARLSTIGSR